METFTKLFGSLLVFVYHCFARIVIRGYLSGLSRPEQVAFSSAMSSECRRWKRRYYLSAAATTRNGWKLTRNQKLPVEWAEKGVRKEDYVLPHLRRMVQKNANGVYFIFKRMEQGSTFRCSVPKFPAKDPNHRILAHQRSRFTHLFKISEA